MSDILEQLSELKGNEAQWSDVWEVVEGATDEIEKLKQFHIDVAFELRGAIDEVRLLRAAMHDIYEVYAGSEGFIPQTCPEAYLQERVKEMANIAARHKGTAAIRDE